MKIVKMTRIGKMPVYDLTVSDNHQYCLKNKVVSHNTGGMLSSNAVWIIGREQEKDGDDLTGYKFKIKIEKSRLVREKSVFPITVTFDGGISKWSGLFDLALELGYIVKIGKGQYQLPGQEDVFSEKDVIDSSEFWESMFTNTDFKAKIKETFSLPGLKGIEHETV